MQVKGKFYACRRVPRHGPAEQSGKSREAACASTAALLAVQSSRGSRAASALPALWWYAHCGAAGAPCKPLRLPPVVARLREPPRPQWSRASQRHAVRARARGASGGQVTSSAVQPSVFGHSRRPARAAPPRLPRARAAPRRSAACRARAFAPRPKRSAEKSVHSALLHSTTGPLRQPATETAAPATIGARAASCRSEMARVLFRRFLATSPHSILGLPISASKSQVKARYYELAKQTHPDVATADGATNFVEIQSAFEELLAEIDARSRSSGGRSARGAAGPSAHPRARAAARARRRDRGRSARCCAIG